MIYEINLFFFIFKVLYVKKNLQFCTDKRNQ